MNTRNELTFLLERFSDGMLRNDLSDDVIFTDDVRLNCYHSGKGRGREAARRLLRYPGPAPEHVKQNIENLIMHYRKNTARMSFHFHQLLILHGENGEFHYLQYGGTFILGCKREGDVWRIDEILFDLCWTDGNTWWIKDWKMIDFRMPKRHRQVIQAGRDGVCRVIPETEEPRSDEEKIKERLFLYGWVIDTEDYELFREIAAEDVRVEDGYHGRVFDGNKEWTDFLWQLNQKEPCLHHTYQVGSIRIKGDRALACMYRLEPNRIGSKTINEETWRFDWLTLDYDVELARGGDDWKLQRVSFRKNIRGKLPVTAGIGKNNLN